MRKFKRLINDLERHLDSLEYLASEEAKGDGDFSSGAAMAYREGARRVREVLEEYGQFKTGK